MLKLKALVRLTIPWNRETIEAGQEFDCPKDHIHQLHAGEYAPVLTEEALDHIAEILSDEDHDLKNLL